MITLYLPPSIEQMIIQNAHAQGTTLENYITSLLPKPRPDSFYKAQGLMAGKLDDMLAHMQQMRDDWD